MMNKKINAKTVVEIIAHVFFWIIVLGRFLHTALLRPKMSITYVLICYLLIIGIVYTNIFVLIPKLWLKNKKLLYCMICVALALVTACIEELFCIDHIRNCVLPYGTTSNYYWYVYDTYVSVTLRNGCFLMFSTLYKLYLLSAKAVQKGEKYISSLTGKIVFLGSNTSHEISLDEISFFEIRKREVTIFADSNTYIQERTFSEIEKLLPPKSYLRINRRCVIMYSHIVNYTTRNVYMTLNGEKRCLPYSSSPTYEVLQNLQKWNPSVFQNTK
ncbi:MAG: LytTR family transcriptional regulator [Bacteroidales bacterium]|nr:LytTR family transcriptional regulator [Bacteroidales bacterium]